MYNIYDVLSLYDHLPQGSEARDQRLGTGEQGTESIETPNSQLV